MNDLWLARISSLSNEVGLHVVLLGVAVDRDLNAYVASESNNSVVVISPDGKNCRTVLGESDGVYKPLAIYFGKVKNNLVVCNYNGTASLYKVE